MSYKIKTSNQTCYISKTTRPYNKIVFNDEKAFGYMEEVKFFDSISLIKSDIVFKDDYSINLQTDSKNIIFTFLLDGMSKYTSKSYKFDINAKKDHTTIVVDNRSNGSKNYAKGSHLQNIQLILKNDYFNSLIEEKYQEDQFVKNFNENKDFLDCLGLNKTNNPNKINTYEIFNTRFEGSLNKLYLQSKIFDILYMEFKTLFNKKNLNTKNLKFTQYDINALYMAKETLIKNIDNPPSIIELSRMVKLNEFKLKIGFKKLFQTTPYGMLFEYKMQKAKQLLEQSELNINEISQSIGYKYPCNFTTAFFKRFGLRPKELMKSRKYYY